jgi:hypothetical protein
MVAPEPAFRGIATSSGQGKCPSSLVWSHTNYQVPPFKCAAPLDQAPTPLPEDVYHNPCQSSSECNQLLTTDRSFYNCSWQEALEGIHHRILGPTSYVLLLFLSAHLSIDHWQGTPDYPVAGEAGPKFNGYIAYNSVLDSSMFNAACGAHTTIRVQQPSGAQ